MKLDTHPTVLAVRKASPTPPPTTLDADWLRDLCLEAGADDVGFVEEGLVGDADLRVTADSRTWLAYLANKKGIVRALITRKLRLKGPARLLIRFGECFL